MKTNIFDRPNLPEDVHAFLAHVRQEVIAQSQGKEFIFLGDANHRDVVRTMFVFSEAMLAALGDAGVKHVILENGTMAHQVFLDAVADGRLTPEKYAVILSVITGYHVGSAETTFQQDLLIGEAVVAAAKMGIQFHYVGAEEGFLQPEYQERYLRHQNKRYAEWLAYTLKNPDFFDKPENLLQSIIRKNQQRYARQAKVNLDSALKHELDSGIPIRSVIFGFWRVDNLKKFGDEAHVVNSDTSLETILERQKLDATVLQRIKKVCQGEKTVIDYGAAHLRHRFGGFTNGMNPDQYTVFIPIYTQNVAQEFALLLSSPTGDRHLDASDNIILIRQSRILKADELFPVLCPLPAIKQAEDTRGLWGFAKQVLNRFMPRRAGAGSSKPPLEKYTPRK